LRAINHAFFVSGNHVRVPGPLEHISNIENAEIFRRDMNDEAREMIDNLKLERCISLSRSEMLGLKDGVDVIL